MAGLPGLGDWPRRNPSDVADSAMAFTLAQRHQRAQTTAVLDCSGEQSREL
jgi:hypothetical protein